MAEDITRLPVEFRHPRSITATEIWDAPEPVAELVWEVCPYIKGHPDSDFRCAHCPPWWDHPEHGVVRRGCYVLAAEACRIVFAFQKRQP